MRCRAAALRCVAAAWAVFLGLGAVAPPAAGAVPVGISGEFRLTLEKAVSAKTPAGETVNSDLELTLSCRQGVWNTDVFGLAKGYNLAFQEGLIVEGNSTGNLIRVSIRMTIEREYPSYDGGARSLPSEYVIDVKRDGFDLAGEYAGTCGKTPVKGKVTGQMSAFWPPAAEGHNSVARGEHPRLFFRRGEVEALRQKAATPEGAKFIAKLKEMLEKDKNGFGWQRDTALPCGEGMWAAGHGFMYVLSGSKAESERARQLTMLAMGRTGGEGASIGNAYRVMGVAMAYDLCYDAWDEIFRNKVADYLEDRSLSRGNTVDSHLDALYYAAGGLAGLAVLGDPFPPPVKPTPLSQARSVEPPQDFKVPAGLVPFKFTAGRMARQWLAAGGFSVRGDYDPLASIGGRAGARPDAGTKFRVGQTEYEFRPTPAGGHVISLMELGKSFRENPEEKVDRTQIRFCGYLYTVLDNDKARFVQAWPNPRLTPDEGYAGGLTGGVSMWIDGKRVTDGELLSLSVGKYPIMVEVPLDCGPYASPRLVEQTEATYKQAMADWQVQQDAYAAAGYTAPTVARRLNRTAQFMRRYLSLALGDHGVPSETGGLAETQQVLLPFAQAFRNVAGKDLTRDTGLEWVVPMTLASHGRFFATDYSSQYWLHLAMPNVMVEPFRPAVKWAIAQEEDLGVQVPTHAIFALLNYPASLEAKPPKDCGLPLVIEDRRMGGYVLRSGWDDANDFTTVIVTRRDAARSSVTAGDFTVYGRAGEARWTGCSSTPGPGWTPSLDEYDVPNVLRVSGLVPTGGAKVTFFESRPNGSGVLSMVQDRWIKGRSVDGRVRVEDPADQGVRAFRSIAVDYGKTCGAPVLLVVVDRVTGGAGKDKWVQLNFTRGRGGPGGTLQAEGSKFTFSPQQVRRTDPPPRGSLRGTVVFPADAKLATDGSDKRPGSHLKITGGEEYWLVMTIQEGDPPEVKVDGTGADARIRIGGQTITFDGEKIILAR